MLTRQCRISPPPIISYYGRKILAHYFTHARFSRFALMIYLPSVPAYRSYDSRARMRSMGGHRGFMAAELLRALGLRLDEFQPNASAVSLSLSRKLSLIPAVTMPGQ
jgi:hypothetical protein